MASRRPTGADSLLQPRIGGLYHGVSRQAPLQRSPNQMQDLENFLPSVDLGGIADRTGTQNIVALTRGLYTAGAHHFFRTTDGQRWALLKRAESGALEVRNLVTGQVASVSYGAWVQGYIGTSTDLRFLTLADTTFILNPAVVTQCTVSTVPTLTSCYIVVKKLSTAAQTFNVTSSVGHAAYTLTLNNTLTRDFVTSALSGAIVAGLPGVAVARVAGNVIKLTASVSVIASVIATNDWDESAMSCIKGRVSATSDLPSTFESGVPIMVDVGICNVHSSYYVSYDTTVNAWIECSYLPNKAVTADLQEGTMPVKLRQITSNSFALEAVDWLPRKTGNDETNPLPDFVGKAITAMVQWKGRLWLAAQDTVTSSQPDDLYNFFRDSAREVTASDPVTLVCESPDLGNVQHLVAFRNKLMVMADNAQLEVPGDKPITPEDATIGVATRYQLDALCVPQVIGDSLYYAGTAEGRSALWEYNYDNDSASNTAFELSKHIPGYVPGRVKRIRGSAQAGRTFLWTPEAPAQLFVHTGYWKDGQRAQNAWARLTFPGITAIQDHWVYESTLYILAATATVLWIISVPVDVNLGDSPVADVRLDYKQQVGILWNVFRNRSEISLPVGYTDLSGSLILLVDKGEGWFREYPITLIWDGTQWVGHFPQNTGVLNGYLGTRFTRTATFSPFYPSMGESVTPMGRLQVRDVTLDALVNCDFTATVTRSDRQPMKVSKSARYVDDVTLPIRGYNQQHRIPFNSQGDKAQLQVSTDSTGPMAITGFTLGGRYTNPLVP
jgi:hypothetical protein